MLVDFRQRFERFSDGQVGRVLVNVDVDGRRGAHDFDRVELAGGQFHAFADCGTVFRNSNSLAFLDDVNITKSAKLF